MHTNQKLDSLKQALGTWGVILPFIFIGDYIGQEFKVTMQNQLIASVMLDTVRASLSKQMY